jgi:hypothetical protein
MSDSDSSDEEARAEVRARLAARLGQTPKADAWAELEQRLKSLDIEGLVDAAGSGLVHVRDVVSHRY